MQNLKVRTYRYALEIIKLLKNLPRSYVAQTLGHQLLRSATSIGANVIEAQAASSKRDFTNFYQIALKSANESKFWLGLIRDSQTTSSSLINPLLEETNQISKILGSSILTLKGKRNF